MQVASKVGNARPLHSGIIRYLRNRQMDGQKQRLLPPILQSEA